MINVLFDFMLSMLSCFHVHCPYTCIWILYTFLLIFKGKTRFEWLCCGGENVWAVDNRGKVHLRIGISAPSNQLLNPAWVPVDGVPQTVGAKFVTVAPGPQDWMVRERFRWFRGFFKVGKTSRFLVFHLSICKYPYLIYLVLRPCGWSIIEAKYTCASTQPRPGTSYSILLGYQSMECHRPLEPSLWRWRRAARLDGKRGTSLSGRKMGRLKEGSR